MERRFARKAWVYFLCVSFFLLTGGFQPMVAQAKEMGRPLGDMLSTGEVKFESRTGVWKNVEPSQFPIYPGMRIKTEKGPSLVTLRGDRQIDVGKNSLFSFNQNEQMELTQGSVEFRLPAASELNFKVGELTISKSLRAPQDPSPVSLKSGPTIGSISVHSNGAVTVKSLQGSLSVFNQERVVQAALSSKDTVTLPSITVKGPPKVMVAQADEKSSDSDDDDSRFLGVPWWTWVVAASGAMIATIVVLGVTSGKGNGGTAVPVCP